MKQLSIGTVARETDLAVSAIRYYEERGLLPPAMRLSNNRRSYGREDVEALKFIAACRKNGMALDSIRSLRKNCASRVVRVSERLEFLIWQWLNSRNKSLPCKLPAAA